jgi:hypothetical protein
VTTELLEEATRRSAVVWVVPAGSDREHPVWHLWHQGALYVVIGGAEQPLPWTPTSLVVVRSKEKQADRLMQWQAAVAPVEPGTPLWDEVVPLLSARRLNAPDGTAQQQRWARESTVLCFTPTGETVPAGDASYAAPPVDSPAATETGRRPAD